MRFLLPVSLVCLVIGAQQDILAQTWTGGGGVSNENWSNSANWSGGMVPASSTTTAVTIVGSAPFSSVVDQPWTIGSLIFSGDLNEIVLGNTLTLADGGTISVLSPVTLNFRSSLILTGQTSLTANGGFLALSGTISGGGSLAISGNGNVELGSASSFTGGATLNGGNLQLHRSGALGTGILTVNSGSIQGGTGVVINNDEFWNGDFQAGDISTGTGLITLGKNITLTNTGGSTTVLTVAGGIGDGGNGYGLTFAGGAGSNQTVLSGVNTYTGATTISNAQVSFLQRASLYDANASAWTAANLTVTGNYSAAIFGVGGANGFTAADIGQLAALGSASGGFQSGSSIGFDTSNAPGGVFTYDGVIANPNGGANALGLIKTGTGSLILTGANTYSGTTWVQQGTLQLGDATHTATVSNTLLVQGTLDIVNANLGSATSIGGGGLVQFGGSTDASAISLAGFAGNFAFSDHSTAGSAMVTVPEFVQQEIDFLGNSSAGNAHLSFSEDSVSTLSFSDSSTAGNATIVATAADVANGASSQLSFRGTSTAGNATIGLDGTGASLAFSENSSAGHATITSNDGSTVAFSGQATADQARLVTGDGSTLDISGMSAGGLAVGSVEGSGTVYLGGNQLTVGGLNTSTSFTGVIQGDGGSLTKVGTGRFTVTGNQAYTGPTVVNGGELKLNGSVSSDVTINSGGTFSGNASVGALTVNSGGTLSPGNSPGTVTATSATWNGGGSLWFQVNQGSGAVAGTNFDVLKVSGVPGTLTINATSGNPFTIAINTLDPGTGNSGAPASFSGAGNYSFTIATTTNGINGFSPSDFSLNTTGVAPSLTGTWSLSLTDGGNDLTLSYSGMSAVPEPSSYGVCAGLAALGYAWWQRRRQGKLQNCR